MWVFCRLFSRAEPARFGALLLAFAANFGCSSADSTRVVREEPQFVEAEIAPSVNACPTFAFAFVLPKFIRHDETAVALVQGTDLDSDDVDLTYAWSATSGEFSDPTRASTDYRCDSAGPQQLFVSASDPEGCYATHSMDVDCADR